MSRASEAAAKAYPPTYSEGKRNSKRVQSTLVDTHQPLRTMFQRAYEQAEEDIISLIESRIGEILGDALPAPVLRAELQEMINKIKEK